MIRLGPFIIWYLPQVCFTQSQHIHIRDTWRSPEVPKTAGLETQLSRIAKSGGRLLLQCHAQPRTAGQLAWLLKSPP